MADWWGMERNGGGSISEEPAVRDYGYAVSATLAGALAAAGDLILTPNLNASIGLTVIALESEHVGFLMAFIALMDLEESEG